MKWLLGAVAAVALLAIVATAALPRVVDTPRAQALIAASAAQALARPVKFRSASLSMWPFPSVRLHGFEIAEDPGFGGGPFVRLDRADLRLRLWPLLRGRVEFATFVLSEPTIAIVHGPGGRWNFSSLGTAREPGAPARAPRSGGSGTVSPPLVTRVVIHKGLVTYERRMAGGLLVRQRLEDLEATLAPRAGGLTFSGSARVMPGGLAVTVADGTLGLGGARTLAEGSLRARVEVDGKDVGPIVAAALGPEPGVGGAITARLDVGGTLGRPRAAGVLEVKSPTVTRASPSCAEPRRRTLALSTIAASVSWAEGRILVQPLAGGIGRGTVTTTLSARPGPLVRAELSDLAVERLPLERVLVDFLCQGYAVAGPLDLTGTLSFSAADPAGTLAGGGRFRVGAGRVVGPRALALLGGLTRALAASPFEFESIAGTYRIADGVLTTRDLVYASRAMTVRVSGDYAISRARVDADVVLEHNRGVIQARVTGPADSPSIRLSTSVARGGVDNLERGFKDLLKKFR